MFDTVIEATVDDIELHDEIRSRAAATVVAGSHAERIHTGYQWHIG